MTNIKYGREPESEVFQIRVQTRLVATCLPRLCRKEPPAKPRRIHKQWLARSSWG